MVFNLLSTGPKPVAKDEVGTLQQIKTDNSAKLTNISNKIINLEQTLVNSLYLFECLDLQEFACACWVDDLGSCDACCGQRCSGLLAS